MWPQVKQEATLLPLLLLLPAIVGAACRGITSAIPLAGSKEGGRWGGRADSAE